MYSAEREDENDTKSFPFKDMNTSFWPDFSHICHLIHEDCWELWFLLGAICLAKIQQVLYYLKKKGGGVDFEIQPALIFIDI